MVGDLKIVSCSSHREFAQMICNNLGIGLCRSSLKRFSNENIKVKIEENVRATDVFVIHTSCPPVSDGLLELLITIDALKHASAGRITAVLPYYPYVRSDKKDEPRISITARLVADLLQTAGADRVLTMDLHSPLVHGFFHIPVDHLTAIGVLIEYFRNQKLQDCVVVAADAGEAKDAGRFARRLDVPLAVIDKRRTADDEQAHAERIIGEVSGKWAIVVDDEVATGGTLVETCRILKQNAVRGVTAGIMHPVLCGPAIERIRKSGLDQLVVTDSIPIPGDKRLPNLHVLSVTKLFSQAIASIHDGRSVSILF